MSELRTSDDAWTYGGELLVGERVRLRGTRDDDLAQLARWYTDPAFTTTNSSWTLPQSEAAVKQRIGEWAANQGDNLGFSIETLADATLIGHIGLFGARPKDKCATIGIGLGLDYVGQGYGTDAVRVVTDYAFREMGLHRVQLGVISFNTVGIRAYTKVGFVEEGRRRAAVFHDGRWYDEVLMSVLDSEWDARRSS